MSRKSVDGSLYHLYSRINELSQVDLNLRGAPGPNQADMECKSLYLRQSTEVVSARYTEIEAHTTITDIAMII